MNRAKGAKNKKGRDAKKNKRKSKKATPSYGNRGGGGLGRDGGIGTEESGTKRSSSRPSGSGGRGSRRQGQDSLRRQDPNRRQGQGRKLERGALVAPGARGGASGQAVIKGVIKRHPDGFGFLIPEDSSHPDVYLSRREMEGVLTQDRLLVSVIPERDGRFSGKLIRILDRGIKKFVGKYKSGGSFGWVGEDPELGLGQSLRIPSIGSKGAKDGDLVAVEILTYPGSQEGFTGQVVEVIGSSVDPLNDIKRVLLNLGIPMEFSPATQMEVKKFPPRVKDSDFQGRRDLRHLDFVTIDGATAKDFDDAIYVEENARGFLLYVAIADVSHYVLSGTALDEDAYNRGTSVYFPNFVVPMLPEILSNELCSLKPKVPRLAMVAEIQMSFTGEPLGSRFYEAVIESKARLTYGEAQEIVDGGSSSLDLFSGPIRSGVLRASDLAKLLMKRRFSQGSLDFNIPEIELEIDAGGNPIDVLPIERLFSHRLIEELMLAANVAVAQFLYERKVPSIYRIHEPPNPEALQNLEKFVHILGGPQMRSKIFHKQKSSSQSSSTSKNSAPPRDSSGPFLQKALTLLIEEFQGLPQSQLLNMMVLRSLNQAKYSSENLGHFGLGFSNYTHFTSPIRRYPDLIVHRILKSQCLGADFKESRENLDSAATILSSAEQRAVKAERQFQSIKKARFMAQHLGESFDGVISSVTRFGVFVLLRAFGIDGLVKVENLSLPGEKTFFVFDEESLTWSSPVSGKSYTLGDSVRVTVARANYELGQVDFVMGSEDDSPAEKKKRG